MRAQAREVARRGRYLALADEQTSGWLENLTSLPAQGPGGARAAALELRMEELRNKFEALQTRLAGLRRHAFDPGPRWSLARRRHREARRELGQAWQVALSSLERERAALSHPARPAPRARPTLSATRPTEDHA